MTETLAHVYLSESTQRELSEFLMNTDMAGFGWFSKNLYVLELWTKVATVSEGLKRSTMGRIRANR